MYAYVGFLILLVPTHDLPRLFWLAVTTGRQAVVWLGGCPTQMQPASSVVKLQNLLVDFGNLLLIYQAYP